MQAMPQRLIQSLAGLALVGALVLSLPGIVSVRADEPDMTPVGPADFAGLPGPEDPAPPAAIAEPAVETEAEACGDPAEARRTQQQLLAQIPQPRTGEGGVEAGEGIVLLNNRGYNYGSNSGPSPAQWQRIEREIGAAPTR